LHSLIRLSLVICWKGLVPPFLLSVPAGPAITFFLLSYVTCGALIEAIYGQCRLLTFAGPIADACSLDEPQDCVHTVIIDCSGFTFIDSVGIHVLPAVSRFKLLVYEPIALQCYDHATVVT